MSADPWGMREAWLDARNAGELLPHPPDCTCPEHAREEADSDRS